jgi:dihydrofolate reductase
MITNTGAVIMGRHTYEMADPFMWANDDYEFQTPVLVLTHTPPAAYPQGNGKLSFTFITDGIESAISRAKKMAGDKDVQVIGGANTIQQCLNAGLCDELQIDIMPVLLGKGLRLFENIDSDKIKLERTKVEATTSARTSIIFKVMN